jgi:hypothetical protein
VIGVRPRALAGLHPLASAVLTAARSKGVVMGLWTIGMAGVGDTWVGSALLVIAAYALALPVILAP